MLFALENFSCSENENFQNLTALHQVSAVVDADILPQWKRRVKLLKHSSDKPLGFYIRDGTNVSVSWTALQEN